jgi:malate dehydrogenase
MERKDLIEANTKIFTTMGRAIDQVASPDVKVLVVANPANTNCLVTLSEASSIPAKNFVALTYLDHQRATAQIAIKLGVRANRIKNVTIWGNHSNTQFPDALTDGYYLNDDGRKIPLGSIMADEVDWFMNDFVSTVQNRGKHVIEVRGASSALSAAQASADCLKTWLVTGTEDGETTSLAVFNDAGYYGVQKGIVFSFPCECRGGNWYVKSGLNLSDVALQKLDITEMELIEEREAAKEMLSKSSRFRAYSTASSTVTMESSGSETDLSTIGQFLSSRI